MVICIHLNRLFLFKSIVSNILKYYSRTPTIVHYRAQSKQLTTQKIDTPEYRNLLTPSLLKLAELFKTNKYELRVAGGAVRDILLGINPHDVDFATTATPEQVKQMLTEANIRMINMNGERHGTITARIDDKENFEVTTLRIDIVTDGRHAVVEYTQDWQLDASRRDLTMNALFLDLEGNVYDYFNGIDDLKHRRIRFVGDPVQRIREDYLRILRYFRFFGRFANDNAIHDQDILKAIKENTNGLKSILRNNLLDRKFLLILS
jgi:tRNA nucleotidyltransferase (CCA-adding enzyme)